jgi:hypothetical protein
MYYIPEPYHMYLQRTDVFLKLEHLMQKARLPYTKNNYFYYKKHS